MSSKGVLTISETGEAVALARGEAHVFATLPYRLTGKVLELR